MQDRTLIVNGVSKGYAMTGWRIGFGAGPAPLIAAMEKWQGQVSSGPSSISQHAAIAALNGSQQHIETYGKAFETRKNLVLGEIEKCAGIEIIMPQGAFYVFTQIDAVIGKRTADGKTINSDLEFALALLERKGVSVVPGSAFGMGEGFRISFAASDEDLRRACKKIIDFWNELR
jgi:aspartate aminotransferase